MKTVGNGVYGAITVLATKFIFCIRTEITLKIAAQMYSMSRRCD